MPRIMLTLTDQLLEFLDEQSSVSGIDRSNLIRARLWDWRTEERDRRLAEARAFLAATIRHPQPTVRAEKVGAETFGDPVAQRFAGHWMHRGRRTNPLQEQIEY